MINFVKETKAEKDLKIWSQFIVEISRCAMCGYKDPTIVYEPIFNELRLTCKVCKFEWRTMTYKEYKQVTVSSDSSTDSPLSAESKF